MRSTREWTDCQQGMNETGLRYRYFGNPKRRAADAGYAFEYFNPAATRTDGPAASCRAGREPETTLRLSAFSG